MREGEYIHYSGMRPDVVVERGMYHNDLLQGPRTEYNLDSQLTLEEWYEEGMLHGILKSYYDNGTLQEESTYVHGGIEGPSSSYYDNGQLSENVTFVAGKKDGLCEQYHKNGLKKLIAHYKLGELVEVQAFNKKGEEISYQEYIEKYDTDYTE